MTDEIADKTPGVYLFNNMPLSLKEFCAAPQDQYNGGYEIGVITLINREKARNNNDKVSFVDPSFVGDDSAKLQSELNKQTGKDFLLTGIIDNGMMNHFMTCLGNNAQDYGKIIIPFALDNNVEGQVGHAVTLVLDAKHHTADIIDQMGEQGSRPSYGNSIDALKENLKENLGYDNITYNQDSLTDRNRMDCACVASMVANDIIAGQTPETYTETDVDQNHQNDQKLARQALFNLYYNDDKFKEFLTAEGKDWKTLSDDEKQDLIAQYGDLAPDQQYDTEARDNADERFKLVVKPHIEEIFRNSERGQGFKLYDDPTYPHALAYRHDDGSKLIITGETSGRIESKNAADHENLCELALRMGCNNMNFGPYFQEHLDEAALLYAASLKKGLGIKNAPDVEKLKEFPQYNYIKKTLLKRALETDKDNIASSQKNLKEFLQNDTKYGELNQAFADKLNALTTIEPQDQNPWYVLQKLKTTSLDTLSDAEKATKEAYEADHQKFETDDKFKTAFEACQTAQKERNDYTHDTEQYKSYRTAQDQYKKDMTDAVEFYISNGDNKERIAKLQELMTPPTASNLAEKEKDEKIARDLLAHNTANNQDKSDAEKDQSFKEMAVRYMMRQGRTDF